VSCCAASGRYPKEARVVSDRNRVTGGGVSAGLDFAITMVAKIKGEQFGRTAELLLEYAPEPPFGCGRPDLADSVTRSDAEARLRASMPHEFIPERVHRAGA
jgi:cyclohexyl-isocyanide hydratase